jgi:hypothetical protein
MEPFLRPFCARLRQLPTFVPHSLRNFKASARFMRLKPQIAGFGSPRNSRDRNNFENRGHCLDREAGMSMRTCGLH